MAQLQKPAATIPAADGAAQPIGNFRWVICGLLFFATAINYIDRQVLGILKTPLSHDLGWSQQDYANIVTAFQFTYAFGYLFGGRLMERFGVKRGLPLAALVWSLFAALHGLMRSVGGFSFARLGLGISEGGIFPAAIKIVGEWFPQKERALATGIFNSASNIGAIICPLTVPLLALKYGWPAAFYITGALGIVWVAVWMIVYDNPETHTRLSRGERAYIERGRPPAVETPTAVPWLTLLRDRAAWAYTIARLLADPVWWFYLFWLPGFLHEHFHLTTKQAGDRVSVVYAIAIVGSIGGGWLAAKLLGRGWSLDAARKTSLLVCALCVLPVFAAAFATNSWVAVMLVGLAAAAHQGWSANLYTFVSDTMPKRAVSSVVGLGGFAAGIASMGNAQIVGKVLTVTHNNYVPIFVWASLMYVVAWIVLQLLVPKIEPANKQAA